MGRGNERNETGELGRDEYRANRDLFAKEGKLHSALIHLFLITWWYVKPRKSDMMRIEIDTAASYAEKAMFEDPTRERDAFFSTLKTSN